MDTLNVFRMAVSDYQGDIKHVIESLKEQNSKKTKDGIKSSFGIIDEIVSSIDNSQQDEKDGKAKFNEFVSFVSIEAKKYKKNNIMGVRPEILNAIVTALYNSSSNNMSIKELLYYIKYVERLYKAGINLQVDIKHEENIIKSIAHKEKLRLEEEKRKSEEIKNKLIQEKLSKMTEGERIVFNLEQNKYDEGIITKVINDIEKLHIEDKKYVAGALKENYQRKAMWDGKVRNKIKNKISKLKEILAVN